MANVVDDVKPETLKTFKTCDLVDELKTRCGVSAEYVEPYQEKRISINGPACILTIID